jgi:hypothetical protein
MTTIKKGKFTAERIEQMVEEQFLREADQEKQALIEDAEQRRGRPSLTGGNIHSPTVSFRIPVDLYEKIIRRAEQEHVTRSEVAREAFEQYLAA